MVQTRSDNLKIVKKFKHKLAKLGVEKIVFFGSRYRGDFTPESDYDLITVSKKFEGVKWYKRCKPVYSTWKASAPLEVFCYTPEEFNRLKNKPGIIEQALKEGIIV